MRGLVLTMRFMKFLRLNLGTNLFKISSNYPIFCSIFLQYLMVHILEEKYVSS